MNRRTVRACGRADCTPRARIIRGHPRNRARAVHPARARAVQVRAHLPNATGAVFTHVGFEDRIFHGPMKSPLDTSLTTLCTYIISPIMCAHRRASSYRRIVVAEDSAAPPLFQVKNTTKKKKKHHPPPPRQNKKQLKNTCTRSTGESLVGVNGHLRGSLDSSSA